MKLRYLPTTFSFVALVGALLPFGLSAALAAGTDFRSIAVGPTPECIVRGFDGRLCVTLMGTSRVKGDGDGKIVMVDGDKVTVLAEGFDDPKGMSLVGGVLVVTDFDKVWTVDSAGTKKLLAGPEAFPKPPLYLNDVVAERGGRSVLVTDMGTPSAMSGPDGVFWPLDSLEAKNIPQLGRVYRVTMGGKVSVVIDHAPEMPNPNGVDLLDDGTILVGEFFRGTLMEWKAGKWRQISDDHRSADGIVHDPAGNLYLTEVRTGRVWKINSKTGAREQLAKLESAADLLLDEPGKQLIVPDSKAGKLVFIPLP